MPANAVMVIFPYRRSGTWMFDDDAVGLKQEPFVSGAPELIDLLVAGIPNAGDGFALYFSAEPFPGFQMKVRRVRSEYGGTWYELPEKRIQGWLCSAMFKYFAEAPPELYVRAEPKRT